MEQFLTLKPMSVNRCWQGRRFKTKEYDKWIEAGLYLLPKIKMFQGEVSIRLCFQVKYPKKSDIDNLIKPVLDLIVKKGWIEDDRYIYDLIVNKCRAEDGKEGVEIEIY